MSLSNYPKRLDMFQTKKNAQFSGDPEGDFVMAEDINVLQDAISAIESSLGVSPQGAKTSVGERITLLEGSSSLRVPSFLIYLGKPALINESETLLEAMGHFAKYDHVVLGNNAMDEADPDHYETKTIIEGVRSSKDIKFYGYIDCGVNTFNFSLQELQNQIQSWYDMGVTGIYCANFGFESRVERTRQNAIVDSIHQHGLVAILNASDPEQVFTNIYHETMNPNWLEPHAKAGDVYHYNRYALDTSREGIFEPSVMTQINMLIKLYEYRVEQGIRIFGTPLIESTVPKDQAQEYYDYAHVSALVTSLDAFHPVTEGYGELSNHAPTYDWVPIAGSWYMASPRVEYDDYGIECVRETPFGRIILNTQEHTYRYEGIYIPYNLLKISANTIEGNLLKDASIEDVKIKDYSGSRLIDAINADTTPEKRIVIGKVMDLNYGDINGDIPASAISANVITALEANIGKAKIGAALIGDLTAEHIVSGTIDAGLIKGSVVEAINLYAETLEAGSAVIGEAAIGDLNADKITAGNIDAERIKAGVVDAINLSAEAANIKDLNANNITAGNISAERMQSDIVQAINLYASSAVLDKAVIDSAAVGNLTAEHIQGEVMNAINFHAGKATIDSAVIGELTTDNMKANVIDAITLYTGTAVIDQGHIGDLSADKITAGTIDVDRLKGAVVEAINLSAEGAIIGQAKIGQLTAEHIASGDIDAERLAASVVAAVELYAQTMTADSATINNAAIGTLDVKNMEAAVISAVNASIETATIKAAKIGELAADNIKAAVIEAINITTDVATIKEAKIGDLSAEKIKTGDIDAERLKANVVNAINITAEHMKIEAGHIGVLTSEHIETAVIAALEANIGTATINNALIGSLTADHIKGEVIKAIDLSAETAKINAAKIGALTAEHISAEVLRAIDISTETATIDAAKIGALTADHIKGVVIKAMDLSTETATIDAAKIRDITAEMIGTGSLDVSVMWANVIEAINLDAQTATIGAARIGTLTADHIKAAVIDAIEANIGFATIDAAVIGELTAQHIDTVVIDALEANIGLAKINQALIDELTADHIKGAVLQAIELSAETATISEAKIADLSAEKITTGNLKADRMKANVISAVNGNFNNVAIESAKIGELEAEKMSANIIDALEANVGVATINEALIETLNASKIVGGEISADVLTANVVEAINSQFQTSTIGAAKIGELKAENIQTEVIKAINASIETVKIGSGKIGQLTADHIKTQVIEAINASIETAKIKSAQIEDLNADKIVAGDIKAERLRANVVSAINAELQTAVINQAKIGDLNAGKITAGDIKAERMAANIVAAVNAYVANMVAGSAIIDSAAIGTLNADHMQAKVLSAINASIETIDAKRVVIDSAKIGALTAEHIETAVMDAINANIGIATIEEAAIADLSAEKIKTGDLAAERMTTHAITAVNADLTDATIKAAKIGALTAEHIQAEVIEAVNASIETATIKGAKIGTLEAESMKAGVITAINGTFETITIESGRIGELSVDNLKAAVIEAVNASVENIKIKNAMIEALTADHIKAVVIDAINGRFGSATIDAAKIGVLEAGNIKAGAIDSTHINTQGLNANVIKTGFLSSDRILFGSLKGDHIESGSIETKHLKAGQIDGSVIKGDTIHGSKIIAGTLSASNLTAGSITSVEIAAKTIQTRNLAAGAVDASVLRAGTISAEHISTVGLDANQIEVFGNDGQVLIGDGYLRVDGLDVGVVQSDNLVGNGLFLTASSGFGYMRDNPLGEAILGSQSKIEGSHQVWRIDTTTGEHIAIDTGGTKPVDIVLDSIYEYAYVTLQGTDEVAQIQVSGGTQAARTGATLKTGKGPGRMLYTGDKLMDHKHFFVLNTDPKDVNVPDSLTIMDAPPTSINQDLYVHHMIPLGNTPYDVQLRMTQRETTQAPGKDNPHPGHEMHTYITQAGQGDIAVLDMSHPNSHDWKVVRNIPIAAHMMDNYHGGLDGRFGLNAAVGGDSSSQYSDAEMAGAPAMNHGHGGYGTSDGSIREYEPHGLALSSDVNHIYVADYANGHLLVIDVNGGAPYNGLTGSRVTGNLGTMGVPPGQEGASGGGTPPEGSEIVVGDGGHVHTAAVAEEDFFSIQAGGHGGHLDDSEPVHVPGSTGVITQEMQTTRWVRYRIPLGDSPERVEVVEGKVFVTLEGSSTVAVLDEIDILTEIGLDYEYYGPRWNEFTDFRELPHWHPRYIEVGAKPAEITVCPTNASIYVTVNGQNQIAKIDVATEEVVRRFNTGPNPKGARLSPDGTHLYVVNHGGSGNLSFVYPTGPYIGDAYLGLEGGVEYQGAEHWVPNRSDWVYDPDDPSKVRSATTVEFHVNEPFLNEGGFTRIASHGVDAQQAYIEQDVFNVVNYSNGNNVALVGQEQLKQDASLVRFWPKNEWLKEYGIRNLKVFAKNDEFLTRDIEDDRVFYPTKDWIEDPERPVILVGLSGNYVEVSENDYEIVYGENPKITFTEAIAGDQEVYSSSYYYSATPDPAKYTVYYEGDVETSTSGTVYGDSHITFADGYLPQSGIIKVDYTFRHDRWFKSHNGSVMIATENSSSENFYVQYEVDEFVPKFVTFDNQQTEDFTYWPIEVPAVTHGDYTGIQYSGGTNRAKAGTVTASVAPTAGTLDHVNDDMEPMDDSTEEGMHAMHTMGDTVTLPGGLQYVTVDLGKTYMVTDIHVMHAYNQNRIYHGTRTQVSQDGVHWSDIYNSATDGEYAETEYMAGHQVTHYGKHHTLRPQPVRYVRDFANGYTAYDATGTAADWTQDTVIGTFTDNHWADIKVFADWEFEKEFSRNYTSELLDTRPQLEQVVFAKGGVTVSGGSLPTNIGEDNEQDVARIVDRDLLPRRYFTAGQGAASVTIDLGEVKQVDTIRVFRFFNDVRVHKGAKTEISTDGTSWTVVYDSDVDGEYEENAKGQIFSLGGAQPVRYIRDSATSWEETLKTGTVLTGNEIRWIGIHAYLDYDASYPYVYQEGSELEGQNLASNGQGVVTTEVSQAFMAIDLPIDFTSWWYMTYIVGPEFGQIDVEMPTVMGGSHSLFEDAPYLNKVAHRHIMSWPTSENVKADAAQNIKAGLHRAVVRQKSGKVSVDRFRFEDYQYLYMNSTEIPKGNATNFTRYKIEPEVAKWYIGRGNQSTEGAYDSPKMNNDTGKPDGSVAIKYRVRVKTRLNPLGLREERGVAYVTSAIFETGRLSSHWRMSQAQDSFPGNRIQRWDGNQPHKTGIQHDHLANGAVRGSKIMPHAVMDHHVSPYAKIEESKLNLKHATHRHGHYMNMTAPDGSTFSVWHDNKGFLDSVHGWGGTGTANTVARADHSHQSFSHDVSVEGNLTLNGNVLLGELGTVDGVNVSAFKQATDTHMASADLHFSASERTKLNAVAAEATKVEASTNGNVKINGVSTAVYAHPTTAGNKHIPTGGASGNFLKYTASGTAIWSNVAWGDISNKPLTFTPPTASSVELGGVKVGSGIQVAADGTISWTHDTSAGNKHVPAGGSSGEALKWAANGTATWGNVSWNEVSGKPTNFSYTGHTHTAANISDLNTVLGNYATKTELAEAGEVKLGSKNIFTSTNTFSNAGLGVKIQPSAEVPDNTVLLQVNSQSGGSLVTVGQSSDPTTSLKIAKMVINGDLEVTGSTIQKSTQEIEGDMNVTGNLNISGDSTLGDGPTDQVSVVGELILEGPIRRKGRSVEVGRFTAFGVGGDLQFQTDSAGYEHVVGHYWTFQSGDSYPVPAPEAGTTRRYRLMVSYSTIGAASDAALRITQYSGGEVAVFNLPGVNGAPDGTVRHLRTPEFTTDYMGHTNFEVLSAGAGKDLIIKHIEVIGYDYFA